MSDQILRIGPYDVVLDTGVVRQDGEVIELGAVEQRLLRALACQSPDVVGRQSLIDELWPEGLPPASRALDKAWSRLRRRLGPSASDSLKTVRGKGLALVATQPEPRTPPAIFGTMPIASTAFVGFEAELEELEQWITGRTGGWITVTGLGGAGKTRLAAEAAQRIAATGDPVVWVDLAPRSDGVGPVLHVARQLGLDLPPGPELDTLLAGALAERTALVVLDNLEHLPIASRRLGEILTPCAGIRVVATSRRRLDVPGERLLRLRGLDPVAEAPLLFAELLRQRWITTDPSHALLDPRMIAEVCAATEGHPLSIELAVATLRRRPPGALLAMLRDAPTRLRGERHGRDARHATFEATFDYSWTLLAPRAQRALAALSLFAGRFDRREAAHLLDVGPTTLDLLVDQSLVGGRDGLVLHPLIRAAGRRRLSEIDSDHAIRSGFRTRLLGWFGAQRREICIESDPDLAARIVARMPDLTAVWHDAIAHGDLASLSAAWPAARAWIAYRDDFALGADWCAAASPLATDPELTVDLTATLGHCLVPLGQAEGAVELLCSTVARHPGKGAPWVRLHLALAGAHARLGALPEADQALEEARRRAEEEKEALDDDLLAFLHLGQGMRLRAAGQSHLTGVHGERALHHARRAQNRPLIRRALVLRGSFLIASSRFEEALDRATEAAQLAEAAHDRQGLCSAVNIRALALRYLGQLDEALQSFLLTREILVARGGVGNLPYTDNQIATLHLELGRLEEAEHQAGRALRVASDQGNTKDISFSLLTLAHIHLAAGRYEQGLDVAARRRGLEANLDNVASDCMTGLAVVLLSHFDGQSERAQNELDSLLRSYPGVPSYIQLQIALASSLVHARAGQLELSVTWARTSLELAEGAGASSLQRSLYPLALSLTTLGDIATAAAVHRLLDTCPPTVERWIYSESIRAAVHGTQAEAPPSTDAARDLIKRRLSVTDLPAS